MQRERDRYCWNIDIKRFKQSRYYRGAAYDWISDELITEALESGDWQKVDISKDFKRAVYGDVRKLFNSNDPFILGEEEYAYWQAARIAALVRLLEERVPLQVYINLFEPRAPSFITDGNHRFRAYEYLQSPTFIGCISGSGPEVDAFLDETNAY